MEMTKRRVIELEDNSIEILQAIQQREKKIGEKNELSPRDLWEITKKSGIHVIGVPERE